MKVGVLFSGGKDSVLALHLAHESGEEIKCLISVIPENRESYMFHYPNINFVKEQAKAMNFPLLTKKSKGEKEKELEDLKKLIKGAISKYKIEGIVSGAIKSSYQKIRIQKICEELHLKLLNPLWMKEDEEIFSMLFKRKFKIMIVGIYAYPFSEKYLGKIINKKIYRELKEYKEKYKISLVGEGGEIESFVLDAPLFNYKIKVLKYEKEREKYGGTLKIKKIKLIKK